MRKDVCLLMMTWLLACFRPSACFLPCGYNFSADISFLCSSFQSRAGITMMAEGVARRDAVAGAALAAGVAVAAPQAASARGNNGKETGAFAADAYSKYQKGYPRNIAPVVSAAHPAQY